MAPGFRNPQPATRNPQPGDTIAVRSAGPVGQFAIRSALMLGASRVIVIDTVPGRRCSIS